MPLPPSPHPVSPIELLPLGPYWRALPSPAALVCRAPGVLEAGPALTLRTVCRITRIVYGVPATDSGLCQVLRPKSSRAHSLPGRHQGNNVQENGQAPLTHQGPPEARRQQEKRFLQGGREVRQVMGQDTAGCRDTGEQTGASGSRNMGRLWNVNSTLKAVIT